MAEDKRLNTPSRTPIADATITRLLSKIKAKTDVEDKFRLLKQELESQIEDRTNKLNEVTTLLQQKILEYEQTNKLLQETEVRFRQMFENMSNCVAIYQVVDNGSDFIFKDFNKAAEKAEGVKREDLLEKSVLQVFPGVKEFGLFDIFQKVWRTGVPSRHPISFYQDKRIIGWRENYVYKLPSGEIVAIYEDVTARKRAEQTLQESEKKYRDLLENLPQKIFQKDNNSIYISCNKNYARDLNIEAARIAGTTDYDYHPKELAEKYIADDRRVIESGKSEDLVEKYIADGRESWVHTVKIPLTNDQGQVTGVLGVFRDITDQKNIEEEKEKLQAQLRQTHKMEAIGTLAGGIAHDFNNILAAILGYADLAKDDIPEWNPAQNSIEEVLTAGNRAKELVKQILTFSRKAEQSREPIQIHLLIKEVCNFLRATIPSTIEIKFSVDPLCGNVLADPTQIHQVILNLCTNAALAMEDKGGVLTITLQTAFLTADDLIDDSIIRHGPHILLSVSDTGVGIEEEHIHRIFDPYYTTREVGKGSGMGLAVVHGIVLSHEGHIQVESTVGKGTTFKLFFPAIKGETHAPENDTSPLPTGDEHILIVDDDISIVNLCKHRLEKHGYQTTTTTSSREAFDLFQAAPSSFDVVVTDQTMPNMTGEELAKKLLEIRSDMPIIMCTGFSPKIDSDKAIRIGIKAFIMKPVDSRELVKTVRQVLDDS